ncbi:hypothetical protein EEB14_25370 [Rhodococcus sp. WS4]|nr:hypothetical protein EEB14_25370 [Rhodococcus sp. WS4]
MAKTMIEMLIDDLDGSEIKSGESSTIHFAYARIHIRDRRQRQASARSRQCTYALHCRRTTSDRQECPPHRAARSSATDPSAIRARPGRTNSRTSLSTEPSRRKS